MHNVAQLAVRDARARGIIQGPWKVYMMFAVNQGQWVLQRTPESVHSCLNALSAMHSALPAGGIFQPPVDHLLQQQQQQQQFQVFSTLPMPSLSNIIHYTSIKVRAKAPI